MKSAIVTSFKKMFTRFCADKTQAAYGGWYCRADTGDGFEIYYGGVGVIACCDGRCEWYGTQKGTLEATEQEAIEKFITAARENVSFK